MSFARLLIFVSILALIELWLVPLPLAFLFLFLWQLTGREAQSMLAAFLIGFLFDIVLLAPFGATSILFVTILFVVSLYTRKYTAGNILFLTAALFGATFVIEFFYTNTVAIWPSVVTVLLGLSVMKIVFPAKNPYESWYRFS